MRNGEVKTIGNATVKKLVIRSSVREPGARTFAQGTRSFQETTYVVRRTDGSLVDFVSAFPAAKSLAETV